MSCDRLSDDKQYIDSIPLRLVIFRSTTLKYYDFEVFSDTASGEYKTFEEEF
jgi:hypothetical protein